MSPTSLVAVQGFYDHLVDTTALVNSPKKVELTKLLENTFRHVNIAQVDELAIFANDWASMCGRPSTRPPPSRSGTCDSPPGPGVGGHCLPIDLTYLSWRVKQSLGRSFRFVDLANDVNEHTPDYVVSPLIAALNDRELSVNGRRVFLLGLGYEKNTGDAGASPPPPSSPHYSQLARRCEPSIRTCGMHRCRSA